MNTKFLELAEQAGFGVVNGSILAETISIDIEITAELKKFAGLIIRQCAELAEDYDGAHYIGTVIKEHFGVGNE